MFFESWALWEKMTFILGVCILIVFAIGYVKLLWTNRKVRKQEVVDEEKRVRIQELRSSGQIIESRKSFDIPFGVRAIQSGIQVDGIWISQSNTPAPSELKLNLSGNSPELAATPSSKSGQVSPDIPPLSKLAGSQSRHSSELDTLQPLERPAALQDASDRTETRGSYRPRKASHLRYGSHGDFDQTTLHQLEGNQAPRRMQVHRPRTSVSRQAEIEAESSVADNELSSGVSSHSDVSLSHNLQSPFDFHGEGSSDPLIESQEAPNASASRNSKAEYFSLPVHSGGDVQDPFQTPIPSPNLSGIPQASGSIPLRSLKDLASDESLQDPGRQHAPGQAPFVPGELHINKAVRKVNSGFEVLPAGTFGIPSELKGKGREGEYEDDSNERRQSTKLQKRARTSMTSGRGSTVAEGM